MAKALLKGMTWNHSRGFDPMLATAKQYAATHPDVEIHWKKRSLQAFADRPIGEMAAEFDLMVIDHPHVGEVARSGSLLPLDQAGRIAEMAALARQSVGASHVSYELDGHQWALAIDAATPVACFRPDRLEAAPQNWDGVLALAKSGQVAFALIPINALMNFMGLAKNLGYDVAKTADEFLHADHAAHVLDLLQEITALIDAKCLTLDPIGVLDWMSGTADAPAYSPFGYGYTNYSRDGFCRYPLCFADAPGVGSNAPRGTVLGGTGIAVSSATKHREIATDYAFWIAGADCQTGLFFDSGGQPGNSVAWESDHCNAASRDFFRNTRETLETSWVRPRYDGYMGFQDKAGTIIHRCLCGEINAGSALDQLKTAYRESRK